MGVVVAAGRPRGFIRDDDVYIGPPTGLGGMDDGSVQRRNKVQCRPGKGQWEQRPGIPRISLRHSIKKEAAAFVATGWVVVRSRSFLGPCLYSGGRHETRPDKQQRANNNEQWPRQPDMEGRSVAGKIEIARSSRNHGRVDNLCTAKNVRRIIFLAVCVPVISSGTASSKSAPCRAASMRAPPTHTRPHAPRAPTWEKGCFGAIFAPIHPLTSAPKAETQLLAKLRRNGRVGFLPRLPWAPWPAVQIPNSINRPGGLRRAKHHQSSMWHRVV